MHFSNLSMEFLLGRLPKYLLLRLLSHQPMRLLPSIYGLFLSMLRLRLLCPRSLTASILTTTIVRHLPSSFDVGRSLCGKAWRFFLVCKMAAPFVQVAASCGRKPNTVPALPPAASIVYSPRTEVFVYMSRFRHWLDGRHFLSLATEGARP